MVVDDVQIRILELVVTLRASTSRAPSAPASLTGAHPLLRSVRRVGTRGAYILALSLLSLSLSRAYILALSLLSLSLPLPLPLPLLIPSPSRSRSRSRGVMTEDPSRAARGRHILPVFGLWWPVVYRATRVARLASRPRGPGPQLAGAPCGPKVAE